MILYDTKYLQLKSTKTKTGSDWFYAHRPNVTDGIVIVPVIEGKSILFTIEERPPLQAEGIARYSVGLPAGLVGDERIGENIYEALEAELREEAGLKANKIELKTRRLSSSPGCVSETVSVAVAYIDKYEIISNPIDDGGIIIGRELVGINDIYKWLRDKENNGFAISAQALAALFLVMEDINDNKRD